MRATVYLVIARDCLALCPEVFGQIFAAGGEGWPERDNARLQ